MRTLTLVVAALALADPQSSSPSISLTCYGTQVFSAEGSHLVERTLDGGRVRAVAIPGMERVRCVAFSPDGRSLAVGGGVVGRSGSVARVDPKDVNTVKTRETPPFNDVVEAVAFSEDGTRIVAASADKTASTFDVNTMTPGVKFAGHTGAILCAAVRGDRLVTGSTDHTIRVWNLSTGALERTQTQHAGAVHGLAFEPSGPRFVSVSADKTLRLWDSNNGRLMRIARGFDGPLFAVRFEARGVFAAGSDGRLRHVNLEDGSLTTFQNSAPDWVYAVVLPPKGDFALLGTAAGVIRIPL